MLNLSLKKSHGDTLIEVLFATAVFSLIAVGGLAVMNQGSDASQRAIEITLVRNEIDAQAETLRFLNASYIAVYQSGASGCPPYAVTLTGPAGQWQTMQCSIITTGEVTASQFGVTGTTCPTTPHQGSFILNTRSATFVSPADGKIIPAQTFSQVNYSEVNGQSIISSADGIWIEAVTPNPSTMSDNSQDNSTYIDFNIRACWDSPGQAVPMTIGTIVRLYEPRG